MPERVVAQLGNALGIGLDADDAVVGETNAGVADEPGRVQQVVDDGPKRLQICGIRDRPKQLRESSKT